MKAKPYFFLCAIIVLCLLGWTGQGQGMRTSRVSWEYKVVYTSYMGEADLNRLGAEGWEYVHFDNGVRTGNTNGSQYFLFKRVK